MQTNPILERIVRISEQWKTTIENNPDVKVFCWQGASMSEYKMIKGFLLFHMSEDSTLDDIFISCYQQFDNSTAERYGALVCEMIDVYIESWNKQENLTQHTGIIDFKSVWRSDLSDVENFVNNLTNLSKALKCDERNKLIVAILPERLQEAQLFKDWIVDLLKLDIDKSIVVMLYDSYDLRLFHQFDIKYARSFIYLQPDFDLGGAMNQILEDVKKEKKSTEDEDLINYQQHLIKMTTAIGEQNEKKTLLMAQKAISLTKLYNWYHLEALIHYFINNLYTALNYPEKAEKSIDQAILYAYKAKDMNIEGSSSACSQYLIVKANRYLLSEKYKKAIPIYKNALDLSKEDSNIYLQITMYQMLGLCYRKIRDKEEAQNHFYEGWELIESFGTDQIKKQHTLLYYANEMSKVLKDENSLTYERRFIEIWGDDWKENLKLNQKVETRRSKAFKTI